MKRIQCIKHAILLIDFFQRQARESDFYPSVKSAAMINLHPKQRRGKRKKEKKRERERETEKERIDGAQ